MAAPLPEAEDGATTASPEPSDEVPHARGPIVLGVEDMGLQDGKGVEMSLGTDSTDDVPAAVAATPKSEEVTKTDSSLDKDGDGDIVLEDTKAKEEPKDEDAATNPTEEDSKSESVGQSSQAPDAKKET